MSNIQNAMETEPSLSGKSSSASREHGDQSLEQQETAAAACPREGASEEHCVLEVCAWGRSEYKPKVCFKEIKKESS